MISEVWISWHFSRENIWFERWWKIKWSDRSYFDKLKMQRLIIARYKLNFNRKIWLQPGGISDRHDTVWDVRSRRQIKRKPHGALNTPFIMPLRNCISLSFAYIAHFMRLCVSDGLSKMGKTTPLTFREQAAPQRARHMTRPLRTSIACVRWVYRVITTCLQDIDKEIGNFNAEHTKTHLLTEVSAYGWQGTMEIMR